MQPAAHPSTTTTTATTTTTTTIITTTKKKQPPADLLALTKTLTKRNRLPRLQANHVSGGRRAGERKPQQPINAQSWEAPKKPHTTAKPRRAANTANTTRHKKVPSEY
ncbi:hypothetical protein E2C01_088298 [Portunus trituberculatus]|uniref:Uncharacterized protein n=1 Tax=Portunus trituberculatus TaxID=210409 RepID=A0A5B7JG82_PORTR|nr:hypothetical protein [Portunus trituberculatus]